MGNIFIRPPGLTPANPVYVEAPFDGYYLIWGTVLFGVGGTSSRIIITSKDAPKRTLVAHAPFAIVSKAATDTVVMYRGDAQGTDPQLSATWRTWWIVRLGQGDRVEGEANGGTEITEFHYIGNEPVSFGWAAGV